MTLTDKARDFYALLMSDPGLAAERYMHPDITWINPLPAPIPFGGVYRGFEGIAEYGARLAESIEMHPLVWDEIIERAPLVVLIGNETDTLVIPTGKRYSMPCVHVLHFDAAGEKILEVREYNDITDMLAAFQPD